jgi:ATP-dependent HslUV protease subunit HslV
VTVIAVKDGVMAADTGNWHGGICFGGARKLWRLNDGSIFGGAGWQPVVELTRDWLQSGMTADTKPEPVADDDLDGLLLKPDGSVWIITHKFHCYRSDKFCNTGGAHSEFLYGAMLAGASAEHAVRLAIQYCGSAAGDVLSERVQIEKTRRPKHLLDAGWGGPVS